MCMEMCNSLLPTGYRYTSTFLHSQLRMTDVLGLYPTFLPFSLHAPVLTVLLPPSLPLSLPSSLPSTLPPSLPPSTFSLSPPSLPPSLLFSLLCLSPLPPSLLFLPPSSFLSLVPFFPPKETVRKRCKFRVRQRQMWSVLSHKHGHFSLWCVCVCMCVCACVRA